MTCRRVGGTEKGQGQRGILKLYDITGYFVPTDRVTFSSIPLYYAYHMCLLINMGHRVRGRTPTGEWAPTRVRWGAKKQTNVVLTWSRTAPFR